MLSIENKMSLGLLLHISRVPELSVKMSEYYLRSRQKCQLISLKLKMSEVRTDNADEHFQNSWSPFWIFSESQSFLNRDENIQSQKG